MIINSFVGFIRMLSKICGFISVALVAGSVIVVCQMVFVRYFMGESVVWQTDFVTYGLASSVFLGAPYVAQMKGHVNVDLLTMYAAPKYKRLLGYITISCAFIFSAIFAYTGWELWYEAWEGQWTTASLWALPLWIPYSSLAIGMTLLALEYFADAICAINDQTVPFGTEPGGHS
ncbi:TRAP transporter small permease [Neptunomonas antarctica]|uniref:TRAP transporter small permease protein n=1 Tax=Neptunomonas antarctica TaxID=619304 RepID=A0A1N7N760_9GAMM|nr:TRAP transporter small permease [Neptunomonas antarctica]SIS94011.1 TRAP-type C4-dicarboxylate transport system, small permease component [Neptunomonas antarctica]